MTVPAWLWLAGALAALTAEVVALVNDTPGDTLSERTWTWTRPWEGFHANVVAWCGRILIGGFLVWLTMHLTSGWWTT